MQEENKAVADPAAASRLERLHPDLLVKVANMLPFADRCASQLLYTCDQKAYRVSPTDMCSDGAA